MESLASAPFGMLATQVHTVAIASETSVVAYILIAGNALGLNHVKMQMQCSLVWPTLRCFRRQEARLIRRRGKEKESWANAMKRVAAGALGILAF